MGHLLQMKGVNYDPLSWLLKWSFKFEFTDEGAKTRISSLEYPSTEREYVECLASIAEYCGTAVMTSLVPPSKSPSEGPKKGPVLLKRGTKEGPRI